MATWREGHTAAIPLARQGNANAAWAMNAAADHFLTDAFAGGHMLANRERWMGSAPRNLISKMRHDLDNDYGVRVHNAKNPSEHWIAYGDNHLHDKKNKPNLDRTLEAVKLSKADIQSALDSAGGKASAKPMPARFPAEELVPIVDDKILPRWAVPGLTTPLTAPFGINSVTREVGHLAATELGEKVWPNDGRIRDWVRDQPSAGLRVIPLDEKVRMINRLLDFYVSDDDLYSIDILCQNSTPGDMAAIRKAMLPRVESLRSDKQKKHLLNALGEKGGDQPAPAMDGEQKAPPSRSFRTWDPTLPPNLPPGYNMDDPFPRENW